MILVYEDESLIVVDKPNKMLVYPSPIAKNCHWFATKELAKMGYENLHTVHRLDRPTSGLLLFAKNKEAASNLSLAFRNNEVTKNYICLVRGYCDEKGSIEKELKKDGEGILQNAKTDYTRIDQVEVDREISKYPSSRFSLLKVQPITGRMHQIRRHLDHIRHPIIGDSRYGDRHYNKYMKNTLEIDTMMLHAYQMEFLHPISQKSMLLKAALPPQMNEFLSILGLANSQALHQVLD